MSAVDQALAAMFQRLVEVDGWKWRANYDLVSGVIGTENFRDAKGRSWVRLCERAAALGAAFAEFENARDEYVRIEQGDRMAAVEAEASNPASEPEAS